MATTLQKKTPTTRALPLGVCPLVIPSAQSWISLEKEPEQGQVMCPGMMLCQVILEPSWESAGVGGISFRQQPGG